LGCSGRSCEIPIYASVHGCTCQEQVSKSSAIGIVFMLLLSPFKNIVGINEGAFLNPFVIWKLVSFSQAFAQLHLRQEKSPKSILTLPLQKFVFLLCNILTLGVGLWKCRSMGLLPTGTGD